MAKKTDKILFVKIENDGFDLGAQRRAIKQNDLPDVNKTIQAFKNKLNQDKAVFNLSSPFGSLVEKSKIATNDDYNLSRERYRIQDKSNSSFPVVTLGDEKLFAIESGGTPKSDDPECWNGLIRWITLADLPATNIISEIFDSERKISIKGLDTSSTKLLPKDTVIVSSRATIGRIGINRVELGTNQGFKNVIIKDKTRAKPEFVALMLTKLKGRMDELASGGTFKEISKSNFATLEIPLPPLSIQEEIVAEIDSYQKIIDGARMVVENYKPRIDIDPEWEIVVLESVCDKITDGTHKTPDYKPDGIAFLRVTDITQSNSSKKYISQEEHVELIKRCQPEKGDILYSKNGTIGVAKLVDWNYPFSIFVSLALLKPKRRLVNPEYLEVILNSRNTYDQAISRSKSGTVTNLHLVEIKQIEIPLPDLDTQINIVNLFQKEKALIDTNLQLISVFEQKIKDRIAKVWGE